MNVQSIIESAATGRSDVRFDGARLLYAAGALDRLPEVADELGIRAPLIVTDSGLRSVGHVDRALAALEDAGFRPAIFDEVSANPTTAQVDAGSGRAAQHNADGLIGLGGGSAMDCAKGINFVLTNGGSMEDYRGFGKASSPMLPSIGVPTTAGTGSESQSYALISRDDSGVKFACGDPKAKFRAVILDPELLVTVPAEVRAATGIDALTHALESYVSKTRNPISQLYAREAWRLLSANLEGVLRNAADAEAWGRMQWGALLAGAAIEHSMLGAAHACANPLTAQYGTTHGIAVGLMLPHVMRFNASEVGDLYDELRGEDDTTLWARFEELRAAAGLPERLRDCGIPRVSLDQLSVEAAEQWTAGFNPIPVGPAELRMLYETAY
jgi:alcohol dehydrogenase